MLRTTTIALLLLFVASCTARAEGEEKNKKEENKNYTVVAEIDPEAVKKDEAATYAITITPEGPWVLKAETPLKITLAPSDAVKADKTTLTAKDLVDPKAKAKKVQTDVTANAAGEHEIKADMSFFLCKEDICQRFKHSLVSPVTCKE